MQIYSLANFVQTFFPNPKIQKNSYGTLSLHSLDEFPIFSIDENAEQKQSCIFVDAITWLEYGLRINWPYLVHFCIESKLMFIKRIAFIRPLPFGNRGFRFAFISPIFAFNAFGQSQIELLDGLKIESFSAIEFEGIKIGMAKTIQIKLVEGGEEENGMDPPFLDNYNLGEKDEAIKEFFSSSKLIYDGDLFNVKNWIYEAKFPSSQGNNEESEKLPKFVEFGQSNCIELTNNNNNWQYKFPQKYSRIGHHYLYRNFMPKSIKKFAKEISLQFLPFFTPKKCIKNGENIQQLQIINPIILLQIENNEGAILAIEELAILLDVRLEKLNCLMEIWEEGQREIGTFRQKIKEAIENVARLGQCICWIQEIGILFGNRRGIMGKDEFDAFLGALLQWIRPQRSNSRIIFIITCSSMEREEMPERLKKLIHWEFVLEEGGEKLDEKERNNYLWQNIMMKCAIDYEGCDLAVIMAKKTKGMTLFELDGLICEAKKMAFNEREMQGKKPKIRLEHLEEALKKRKSKGKYTKLGMNLADVGGLDETKMLLKETLAELVKENDGRGNNDWGGQIIRRRSGILLYGPPGCGKTLLAKAVANEFGLKFLSVKGPELLSQYVGESEKNLRELFAKGRKNAPAVLFFDELDSLAPRRGGNTDSGGVMDRMVSQLLTELDNCQWKSREKPIFVMGATNRADLLDPCLLAPGRFEKLVPILPATNLKTKEAILGALCKNVKLANGLAIQKIAQKCPESMSGADLAGIVRVKLFKFNCKIFFKFYSAKMHRIREIIQKLENGQQKQGDEHLNEIDEQQNDELIISAKHFEMALNEREF